MVGTGARRARIVETAAELFYAYGIRAVGVDRVVAESGVSKMTLYRHFPTKDKLVEAALEHRHAPTIAFIRSLTEDATASPAQRLVLLFDRLEREVGKPAFRGCAFANAVLELHEPGHPVREVAERHKRETADLLELIARDAGARAPRELAEQLVILLDGAMVHALVRADASATATVAQAVRVLVAAQITGAAS